MSGTAYAAACGSDQEWEVTGTLYSDGYLVLNASDPYPGDYGECVVTTEINLAGYIENIENKGCDLLGPDLDYEYDDLPPAMATR